MERRTFIRYSATGAMAAASPLLWGNSEWKGANDRINVAVIGIHGMGKYHIQAYQELENVRVAALCDVDETLFPEVVKEFFFDKGLKKPKLYTDLRKLYEDKSIDAVSIVTPNHWHALAAIWAIQAGKHVSVEKPCCHNILEGQKLVEAALKYDVIVQDGAEQRSNPGALSMADFLHHGGLGEVYMAKGLCYKWRNTIGHKADAPVPPGVDYDLWLGPAPKRPFNPNRFHYNWHWNWDYGNGDMGNQGVHEMDVARWGLNVKLPRKISSVGGHFMFDDDQQTPNSQMSIFEFDNPLGAGDKKKILQFEVRHWITNPEGGLSDINEGSMLYKTNSRNNIGNLFYGSEGYMSKHLNGWFTYMGEERAKGESGSGIGNHFENFCRAIRANDQSLAMADIQEGFYSCALIHLGNISYRVGRSLEFDPETMRFINDDEANGLLSREYRAPFVLPDVV